MMRRPPRHVDVEAAAKVNIGWQVGPLREDGFHEVTGVMQTISLADRLEITTHDSGDRLLLTVPGHPDLEENNLIYSVANHLSERCDPLPTSITLHKQIPIGAGLGGGSADAAGALVGLNVAWGAGLSARELLELGAEIGSDVPGLLLGGLVHASGRGERVKRIGETSGYTFVLGIWDEPVSTPAVYAKLDELRADLAIDSGGARLEHNDLELVLHNMTSDRESLNYVVRGQMSLSGAIAIRYPGSPAVFISGSGPTVVGVLPEAERAQEIADAVAKDFRRVLVATPTDWGVRLKLGPKGSMVD